jgi:hypothetical protein
MEYGQHPDFWIELFVQYASTTEPYAFGVGPYADPSTYHLGWKPPLIKQVGSIEQSSSNGLGQPQSGILQVEMYDFDNFLRLLLRDPAKGAVLGYELCAYVCSRKRRKQRLEPTLVHRGFVSGRGLPQGKLGVLTSQDAVGAQFGPFAWGKKIPDLMIGPPGFLYAPDALAGKQPAPMAYGQWTDKGTTLEDGTLYEKGRIPLYYVGNFVIGSNGTITPVNEVPDVTPSQMVLPPPPAPTYETYGTPTGTHTWTFAVESRTAGGLTTLGAPLTITNMPGDGGFTTSDGIILHLTQYSAELQAQVLGARVYVKEGTADSPNPWRYVDAAGEIFNTATDDPYEAGPYSNSDGIGYEVNGDDSFHKGFNPPQTTNTATITFDMGGGVTGQRYRGFVATRHRFEIADLFATEVTADQTVTGKRVLVPLASPDFVRYGSPGWPIAGDVVPVAGYDYTMVFGMGTKADMAATGQLTAAVNGCGYTVNGTSGTDMIGDPFDQMARLLNDFVFYNNGKGHQIGAFPGYVTFPGSTDVQIVNFDSLKACSAYYEGKLGRKPEGAAYINQQVSLSEIIRQFCQDTSTFEYADQFGRISFGIIDEATDFTNAQRLRDRVEIRSMGSPVYDDGAHCNQWNYVFDYDPDLQQYRLSPRILNHAASQTFYRRIVPDGGSPLHQFRWTNDEEFVEAVKAHDSLVQAYTPTFYPIVVSYAPGLNLDINTPVLVDNDEHNFVERKMLIMDRGIGPPDDEGTVTLTCLDVHNIMAP